MNLASEGFVYIYDSIKVMHGGHLFSSYLRTSQNEATRSAVPRMIYAGSHTATYP